MWKRPESVKLFFRQKHPYSTGTLEDEQGRVWYRFKSEGDGHSFSKLFTTYPLHVHRAKEDYHLGTLHWEGDMKKSFFRWSNGPYGPADVNISQELMNDRLIFSLPNGARYEWDGDWTSFWVINHIMLEVHKLTSLLSCSWTIKSLPPTVALYHSRLAVGERDLGGTALEISKELLAKEWILDYVVISVLWLEQKKVSEVEKKETRENLERIANNLSG